MILVFNYLVMAVAVTSGWQEDPADNETSLLMKKYEPLESLEIFQEPYPVYDLNPPKVLPMANWTVLDIGAVPYAAVIHDWNEVTNDFNDACGAVLLTTKKLMTLCGCVVSFLHHLTHEDGKGKIERHPAGVKDLDILSNVIYVSSGSSFFSAQHRNPKSILINDPERQINATVNCLNSFATNFHNPEQQVLVQSASVAVLNYQSEQLTDDVMIPWPPAPVLYDDVIAGEVPDIDAWGQIHPKRDDDTMWAALVSFELDQVENYLGVFPGRIPLIQDAFGNVLNVPTTLIQWDKRLCPQKFCKTANKCLAQKRCMSENELLHNIHDRVVCMCGVTVEGRVPFCGGLPGSPVISVNGFHGLAMTHVKCGVARPPDFLETLAFTQEVVNYVERLAPEIHLSTLSEDLPASIMVRNLDHFDTYEFIPPRFTYINDPEAKDLFDKTRQESRMSRFKQGPSLRASLPSDSTTFQASFIYSLCYCTIHIALIAWFY